MISRLDDSTRVLQMYAWVCTAVRKQVFFLIFSIFFHFSTRCISGSVLLFVSRSIFPPFFYFFQLIYNSPFFCFFFNGSICLDLLNLLFVSKSAVRGAVLQTLWKYVYTQIYTFIHRNSGNVSEHLKHTHMYTEHHQHTMHTMHTIHTPKKCVKFKNMYTEHHKHTHMYNQHHKHTIRTPGEPCVVACAH
jgi:hypothetical protein